MSEAPLLAASRLRRDYAGHWAVWDLDLRLFRGQILGLLGQNGAGKSTTLAMLSGNLSPRSGAISIGGVDLLERPVAAKSMLGYLPDRPPVHRELTVDEYLRYSARLHKVRRDRLGPAVQQAKRRCGLQQQGPRLIGGLSKGYQQRVGIAQAIVHEPQVIILDEPTVGLDPIQLIEIRTLVRELGEDRGVILSSHMLSEVENLCTDVLLMQFGRVRFAARLDGIEQRSAGLSRIRLLRPPAQQSLLETVSGVHRVEALGEGDYLVHAEPGSDPAEALATEACRNDWGLTLLAPEPRRLERMFVDLATTPDHPEQAS